MLNNSSFLPSILTLLVGFCFGSFLNAGITRIPAGISLLFPPSECDHCKNRLSTLELIPLVSFFLQKGRCRHCHASISWQNPVVELLTGLAALVLFLKFGFTFVFFFHFVFSCLLLLIAFIDLNEQMIPDSLLLFSLVTALFHQTFSQTLPGGILGGISSFVILFAIAKLGTFLYKKAAMGEGDPLLAGVIGLFLGWPASLVALYFAFISGAGIALPLLLLKKRDRMDYLPFGPMLVMGASLALFFSVPLLSWLRML